MLFEGVSPFFIGCNYWASHAGTRMWSQWDMGEVEADLRALRQNGMEVLRVFPLWPDFQPIDRILTGGGYTQDIRIEDQPLPADKYGQAGIHPEAMRRFSLFLDACTRQNLRVIVSLINGFMSGRLFVPPALQGRNILTDPEAVRWQLRFIKVFVEEFRAYDCVVAWDLGNECNNIENVPTRDHAYVWAAAISNAIHAADPSRPVVSGMHGLRTNNIWTIADQGELTDVLTTHPYPYWVPPCDLDGLDRLRPLLHAACESVYYADIGGKPCFAEEIGSMGPMIANDAVAEHFIRGSLLNLWAHGCHGALWWCAFDQGSLDFPPYDYCACENELGILTADRMPKPVMRAMQDVKRRIESLPCHPLPPRTVDAVCIVSARQDQWGAALSSFLLAKQAHMDITYQLDTQPLKDSRIYLLPSLAGSSGIPKSLHRELLEKVHGGAVLYISCDDGYLTSLRHWAGIEVIRQSRRAAPSDLRVCGDDALSLPFQCPVRFELRAMGADILAAEPDGNPLFTCYRYGEGYVFFLGIPMEAMLASQPETIGQPQAFPYYTLYQTVAHYANTEKWFTAQAPCIGMTEHEITPEKRLLVLLNYTSEPQSVHLNTVVETDVDTQKPVVIPPFDMAVLTANRQNGKV